MFEIIIKVVFVLFAIFGMVESFRIALFWLLEKPTCGKFYYVIPMRGHNEEAELILRSAYERVQWLPDRAVQVLVVDCGMDDETRRICELTVFDLPEIQLCFPEEIDGIFRC
jgi:hypothetical protein